MRIILHIKKLCTHASMYICMYVSKIVHTKNKCMYASMYVRLILSRYRRRSWLSSSRCWPRFSAAARSSCGIESCFPTHLRTELPAIHTYIHTYIQYVYQWALTKWMYVLLHRNSTWLSTSSLAVDDDHAVPLHLIYKQYVCEYVCVCMLCM